MQDWMIAVLIIGAIIAIWFNIWNYKDNKKRREKLQAPKYNLDKSYENSTRPQTVDEKEQNERIIKRWKEEKGEQ